MTRLRARDHCYYAEGSGVTQTDTSCRQSPLTTHSTDALRSRVAHGALGQVFTRYVLKCLLLVFAGHLAPLKSSSDAGRAARIGRCARLTA